MRPAADERMAVAAAIASLLGATTLSPLVAGHTWLVVAGVIVVIVMITGIIARHLISHWFPVTVLQVIVLLVAFEVLFARSRVVEGPGAITALSDLLQAGLEITRTQPPPVEATQGVILLAAGGAGVMALVIDVLACSLRQPALAGLPLLAIYCVPAALLSDGLPWYYFAGAAAGFLLLLAADTGDRAEGWGRVLSSQPRSRADGLTNLGSGGRRAAAAAVVFAVLVPAVMPGLGNQILGGSGDGDGNGKSGSIKQINPIIDLRKNLVSPDDTDLIWYTTDVKDPQPLRIVTADVFDGSRWAPNKSKVSLDARVQDGLPSAPGLTGANVQVSNQETRIRVGQLAETYLPLPYPATKVQVRGEWLYDRDTLNVIGRGVTTQGLTYTADYDDVEPTADQLDNAPAASPNLNSVYLSYPRNTPSSILDKARQVAGDGTDYQKAIRLQQWLREDGGFVYDTNAPVTDGYGGSSTNAIVEFLKQKHGYCVHFASTMALMARMLNIPARVAIGFLPGERQANGEYVISSHDAHAWPELYFEGVGWVRFEPTPRAGLATPPEWAKANANDPETSVTPSAVPTQSAVATPRPAVTTPATAPAASQSSGGVHIPWRLALVVLVLGLLLLGPWLSVRVASARRWSRAHSPPAQAEAAWEELRLGLTDLGDRWAWTWTPRAVQHRLTSQYPGLGDAGLSALGRLVAAIEAARYAPPAALVGAGTGAGAGGGGVLLDLNDPAAPAGHRSGDWQGSGDGHGSGDWQGSGDLRADVRLVLDRIGDQLPRGRRLRARFAPPSAAAALNSGLLWVVTLGRSKPAQPGNSSGDIISR